MLLLAATRALFLLIARFCDHTSKSIQWGCKVALQCIYAFNLLSGWRTIHTKGIVLWHQKLCFLAEVLPRILSAVFVEGLVHGNLTSAEAMSLGHKVQATLPTAPVSADDRPKDRVLQLPRASLCYRYTSCHASLLNAQHV